MPSRAELSSFTPGASTSTQPERRSVHLRPLSRTRRTSGQNAIDPASLLLSTYASAQRRNCCAVAATNLRVVPSAPVMRRSLRSLARSSSIIGFTIRASAPPARSGTRLRV